MSVLRALDAYYRRLADRGDDIPPFGYSTEAISFALVLDAAGEVVDRMDLRALEGKKRAGKPLTVPQSSKRPGVTPRAFFLWDNSKYVLGLGVDKASKGLAEHPGHFAAFRDRHEKLLADSEDAGLRAVLGFVRRWSPERFAEPSFKFEMLDQNLAFVLDGDEDADGNPRFVHDRPAARLIWETQAGSEEGEVGTCLVTGREAPVARLHPAIKGVWGAQSSGASLVSFNLDAFASYGKEQGGNAPVSEAAAFNYGTALNKLLERESRNRVQIGDASVAFWADTAHCSEAAAQGAERLVTGMLEPPHPREDALEELANTKALREALEKIRDQRAMTLEEIDPGLDPDTGFYILGLAPNAARLSVRFWHQTTLGPLVARIGEHWRDLNIKPFPWRGQPAARALLYQVAVLEKAENIPPLLGGELMRAILTGGRYPRALLAAVIQRLRAGEEITGARAAICKAWLVRDARLSHPDTAKETYLVSLDRTEPDAAYRLGRLFAVLENVQRAALGRVNASIRDRYFGAASATPASVFPLLLRGANHHLAVLRKKTDTGGLAVWFEREMGEILDKLAMTLPRHLRLEDQGRFAVGYYHQRTAAKPPGAGANSDPSNSDKPAEEV